MAIPPYPYYWLPESHFTFPNDDFPEEPVVHRRRNNRRFPRLNLSGDWEMTTKKLKLNSRPPRPHSSSSNFNCLPCSCFGHHHHHRDEYSRRIPTSDSDGINSHESTTTTMTMTTSKRGIMDDSQKTGNESSETMHDDAADNREENENEDIRIRNRKSIPLLEEERISHEEKPGYFNFHDHSTT